MYQPAVALMKNLIGTWNQAINGMNVLQTMKQSEFPSTDWHHSFIGFKKKPWEKRIQNHAISRTGASQKLVRLLLPLLDYRIEIVPEKTDPDAAPQPADAKPKLVEVIVWSEPDAQVRLSVIQSLGAIKSVDALPRLIDAMERAA